MTPADTYLSFILSRPLMEVWIIFLLGLARIVPTIAIAPFLGGKMLSDPMKLGLAVAINFIFFPFLIVHTTALPTNFDLFFILLLVKESLIGALLGMIMAIPYYYVQSAGALIDQQRGAQSLQVQDPMTQTQSSSTGTLMTNLIIVIFFTTGGPLFFFEGVFNSFKILPIEHFLPPTFFTLDRPLWLTFLDLGTLTMSMALQLSAPALLAMLMADLFLGIANRMAPQVQITFLLYSLKSYAGIGIMTVGWWILLKQLDIELINWYKIYTHLIHSLGP